MTADYRLVVSGPAAHAIAEELSESVASAVIEVITGPLLVNPRRLGRELRNDLVGTWSARRGSFRILYLIDEDHRTVRVISVEHRRDAYRS